MLRLGAALAPRLPRVVMPLVERRLRAEATGVILPAERPGVRAIISRPDVPTGVRCNVNVLGEAIVGDDEARRRLDAGARADRAAPTSTMSP